MGEKFARNRSICYHFEDIFNVYSPLHRTLLYYPVGQKFVRNRSISNGFQDIHTFSFSAKIQDGRQKWRKLQI